SRFAGTPDIVGRTISLDGDAATIIGVLPADFEMPTLGRPDFVVPLQEKGVFVRAFGRLRPGINVQKAEESLKRFYQDTLKIAANMFGKDKVHLQVRTLRERQ